MFSTGGSSSKPSYSFVKPSHSTSSHHSSSSHYKRRPRDNYIARLYARIRRYLRQLWSYVRKHPVKVLLPVVMALVSGGVLHNMARGLGVNLPDFLKGDAARGGGRGGGGGFGVEDAFYGSQNMASGGGMLTGAMKMASAFL